jgi:GT2 family glycosyltransferase
MSDGPLPTEEPRVPLSVVVIAENEESEIRDCIESVVAACRRAVSAFEVILVDSASTDRTVERASDYPVTILRIPEEHVVSCGAGRYVGEQIARGEMILHVDGDLEVSADWLPQAVDHLREHDVAAVGGYLNECRAEEVRTVDFVGGIVLYDADALREVGGFDPHLLGYEDVDVGYRLNAAGHDLVRLPVVSGDHPERETLLEPIRRWRAGYYIAPGQAIRKWATSPGKLRKLLGRQRYKLGLLAWLTAGVAAGATATVTRAWLLLAGWVALSGAGYGALAADRGVREAAEFLLVKSMGIAGLAIGLGVGTPPAEEYPLDSVAVIEDGDVYTDRTPVVD